MRRIALLTKVSRWLPNALCLVAGAGCIACADAANHASADLTASDGAGRGSQLKQQPIAEGELFVEEPGVLAVVNTQAPGARTGLCTGTLILPNLILTARHCVAPSPEGRVICGEAPFGPATDPSNLGVSPDTLLDEQSPWFGVERIYVPPEGQDVCGADIALLLLPDSFRPGLVPPLEPRLDEPVFRGEPYSAVGYGMTGEDAPTAGLRRARGNLQVRCSGSLCADGVAETEFAGETGACEGDSGGPALDANGLVIGALSRGGTECTRPIYGSVSQWSSWISEVALLAAEEGGHEAPTWVFGQEASELPRPDPAEPSEFFPTPELGDLEPIEGPEVAGARLHSSNYDRCSVARTIGSQAGLRWLGWAAAAAVLVLRRAKKTTSSTRPTGNAVVATASSQIWEGTSGTSPR